MLTSHYFQSLSVLWLPSLVFTHPLFAVLFMSCQFLTPDCLSQQRRKNNHFHSNSLMLAPAPLRCKLTLCDIYSLCVHRTDIAWNTSFKSSILAPKRWNYMKLNYWSGGVNLKIRKLALLACEIQARFNRSTKSKIHSQFSWITQQSATILQIMPEPQNCFAIFIFCVQKHTTKEPKLQIYFHIRLLVCTG